MSKDATGKGSTRARMTYASGSHYHHAPLLRFLLGSGLRFGEAIGLRWSDADLANGTVSVRRAIVWEGTARYTVISVVE